jgi:hypothetical protein
MKPQSHVYRYELVQHCHQTKYGGGERDRTDDLLLAKQALSQLSYTPGRTLNCWTLPTGPKPPVKMVGLGRFELPTSRLSGVRSNQLSYRPLGPYLRSLRYVKEHRAAKLRGPIPKGLIPQNQIAKLHRTSIQLPL